MRRRDLIKAGALTAGWPLVRAFGVTPADKPAPDPWRGLKLGVASYSLRKLSLEAAIAGIQRVGLRHVSIKDFHLPFALSAGERRAAAQRFRDAGITPMSCGNVTLQNDAAECRRAFEYARDIGVPTIVCSPHPDSLAMLAGLVKEFDIRLAIHNHGPEDKRFPSPYDVWNAVERYDRRIGLCLDVGHTARAGVDPAEAIRKCRERLFDFHLKDIDSTRPDGKNVELGRGVLDIPAILRALLEVRYAHIVSFEYEKDEHDPLPGLSESVGYAKGVLAGWPA